MAAQTQFILLALDNLAKANEEHYKQTKKSLDDLRKIVAELQAQPTVDQFTSHTVNYYKNDAGHVLAASDGSEQPFYGVKRAAFAVSFGGQSPLNRAELAPTANIYLAELLGIDMALKTALLNRIDRLVLYVDNKPALDAVMALKDADHEAAILQIMDKHPLAKTLIQRLAKLTKKFTHLSLIKIKSHTNNTDIPSLLNADADSLAVNILKAAYGQVIQSHRTPQPLAILYTANALDPRHTEHCTEQSRPPAATHTDSTPHPQTERQSPPTPSSKHTFSATEEQQHDSSWNHGPSTFPDSSATSTTGCATYAYPHH